jgi:GTPase
VVQILADLGIDEDGPQIIDLWNKVDLLDNDAREELEHIAERQDDVFLISAETGEGLEVFKTALSARIGAGNQTRKLIFDGGEGEALSWLYSKGKVESEESEDGQIGVTASLSARNWGQFDKLFGDRA